MTGVVVRALDVADLRVARVLWVRAAAHAAGMVPATGNDNLPVQVVDSLTELLDRSDKLVKQVAPLLGLLVVSHVLHLSG